MTIGYSNYSEICPNIYAFASTTDETLFVEIDSQQIVQTIWFSNPLPSTQLKLMPKAEQLLFIDWGWLFVTPINNTHCYDKYLKQRHNALYVNT